ncbi:hypothetical protein QIH87_47325 [Bradyrhizobium elkanii]|uniref:hypothetical protein n=1 Tax=Bradyrhizobium elkanii TaxID=29448 RepID=UPI0027148794|nr:hypothetical protein [Bradyrhizobium elkanii]WLB09467.1 hypothetical protein QIH87_47325 [Bradyrhizobium elkanii]
MDPTGDRQYHLPATDLLDISWFDERIGDSVELGLSERDRSGLPNKWHVQRSDLGKVTTGGTGKLIGLDNLRRKMFPVVIGNRYSYRATMQTTSRSKYGSMMDTQTTEYSCEVLSKYEARRFHPDLTGDAYLEACEVRTTYAKNSAANNRNTSKSVFFESLGFSMMADPISPPKRLVMKRREHCRSKFQQHDVR